MVLEVERISAQDPSELTEKLQAFLKKKNLHSYDVHEFLLLNDVAGSHILVIYEKMNLKELREQ